MNAHRLATEHAYTKSGWHERGNVVLEHSTHDMQHHVQRLLAQKQASGELELQRKRKTNLTRKRAKRSKAIIFFSLKGKHTSASRDRARLDPPPPLCRHLFCDSSSLMLWCGRGRVTPSARQAPDSARSSRWSVNASECALPTNICASKLNNPRNMSHEVYHRPPRLQTEGEHEKHLDVQ